MAASDKITEELTLAPVAPEHTKELGRICFEAFRSIHDKHAFDRDFPTLEAAEGVINFIAARDDTPVSERSLRAMRGAMAGNAALAAKHALDHHGLNRVAVLDFDVHHGNGTQDLLWDEPRALFVSSHQMPLWPGSGREDETGAHDNVLNLPLAPGTGGAEMRAAWSERAFPRLREFAPDLVVISAGFDAHQDDPLAQLAWSTGDFRWITAEICALARDLCAGRIVSTLEGGYDLTALGAAARAHVEELTKAAT